MIYARIRNIELKNMIVSKQSITRRTNLADISIII